MQCDCSSCFIFLFIKMQQFFTIFFCLIIHNRIRRSSLASKAYDVILIWFLQGFFRLLPIKFFHPGAQTKDFHLNSDSSRTTSWVFVSVSRNGWLNVAVNPYDVKSCILPDCFLLNCSFNSLQLGLNRKFFICSLTCVEQLYKDFFSIFGKDDDAKLDLHT